MLSPSLPSSHKPHSHQANLLVFFVGERRATTIDECMGDHVGPCIKCAILQIKPWTTKELFWGKGINWVKQY